MKQHALVFADVYAWIGSFVRKPSGEFLRSSVTTNTSRNPALEALCSKTPRLPRDVGAGCFQLLQARLGIRGALLRLGDALLGALRHLAPEWSKTALNSVFNAVAASSERRNAALGHFEQRFKHRNGNGFGVSDIYASRELWRAVGLPLERRQAAENRESPGRRGWVRKANILKSATIT